MHACEASRWARSLWCAAWGIALAAILPGGALSQEAAAPPGRSFYAPFDGSLEAAEAAGDTAGKPEGKPEFAPGHRGQGLVVGDLEGAAGVLYQTAGNFSLERGTVALWVQPVNWQGDDGLHHLFFQAWPEAGGLFSLYKYQSTSWGLTFYLDPGTGPRAKMYCYQPINEWRPGEWHHVACAWTRYEGMALYIDGVQVRQVAGTGLAEGPAKPEMRFGGDWRSEGSRTVIDEAMIFGRMLAPHEVARLAGVGSVQQAEQGDIPGVMLTHAILGQKVLARVYDDCLGEPMVDMAQLSLIPEAGGEVVAEQSVRLEHGLNSLQLDLRSVAHGQYQAEVRLLAGGEVRAAEALTVSKETDDTWETAARLGKEDTVLPPFTPLAVAGHRVQCYGRAYDLGGSGLPQAITSGGVAMLAGPVRVVAETPDGPVAFSEGQLQGGASSATQAETHGGLASEALTVRTEATARYDGTLWTVVRFLPNANTELSALRIEIPVAGDQARYLAYLAPARIDEQRLGYDALPEGQGVLWSREFLPSIWLGTEDRGIGWFAESDQHWDTEGEGALTIERREGAVVLSMNVIRKPRRLAEQFSIAFGLQATPVRPLAPDWRSYQWVPSTDITDFFLHLRENPYPRQSVADRRPRGKVCYLYAYHRYFTNTLPKDPGEFREMLARAKGYGLLCTPYTEARFLPEWDGDFLLRSEQMAMIPEVRATSYGPVCNIGCCHQGPWSDWYVWYASHLVREYGMNGIYLDEMWPLGCANAAHGCGYLTPDGQRRPTYAVRAALETFRRLRAVFATTGEPFWITYHLSGGRVPPLPTYGDCLLLGEELYYRVRENPDYLRNTTPTQWLAGFAPQAWGIPVTVIPQFKMSADWMKDPELAAKFMAAVVPHDVMVWPVFADTETIMTVRSALEKLGVGEPDVTLLPYWRADARVACENPLVKVTGYLRPGKLLLCVANWSDAPIEPLQVGLDLAALGLPARATARDALTGEAVPLAEGRVSVATPAEGLRVVEVK